MVKPWYSQKAIDAGARWADTLAGPLSEYKFGILCLTPENRHADWLIFEAGCLAKTLDDDTRVVPYLFGGIQPADITGPFTQFQMKVADREGTLDIIKALNIQLKEPLPDDLLLDAFSDRWPKLEAKLAEIPAPQEKLGKARRDMNEMLEEVLGTVREIARRPWPAGSLYASRRDDAREEFWLQTEREHAIRRVDGANARRHHAELALSQQEARLANAQRVAAHAESRADQGALEDAQQEIVAARAEFAEASKVARAATDEAIRLDTEMHVLLSRTREMRSRAEGPAEE